MSRRKPTPTNVSNSAASDAPAPQTPDDTLVQTPPATDDTANNEDVPTTDTSSNNGADQTEHVPVEGDTPRGANPAIVTVDEAPFIPEDGDVAEDAPTQEQTNVSQGDTPTPPEAAPEAPKPKLIAEDLGLPATAQPYLTYIETRWGQTTLDPKLKSLVHTLVDYESTMIPSAPISMDMQARQQLALRNAYLGALIDKTNISKIVRFMLVCYMMVRNAELFSDRNAFRGLIPPYFPNETATEFRLVLTTLMTYLRIGSSVTTSINIARAAESLPAGHGGVDVRAEFLAMLAQVKANRPTA